VNYDVREGGKEGSSKKEKTEKEKVENIQGGDAALRSVSYRVVRAGGIKRFWIKLSTSKKPPTTSIFSDFESGPAREKGPRTFAVLGRTSTGSPHGNGHGTSTPEKRKISGSEATSRCRSRTRSSRGSFGGVGNPGGRKRDKRKKQAALTSRPVSGVTGVLHTFKREKRKFGGKRSLVQVKRVP